MDGNILSLTACVSHTFHRKRMGLGIMGVACETGEQVITIVPYGSIC